MWEPNPENMVQIEALLESLSSPLDSRHREALDTISPSNDDNMELMPYFVHLFAYGHQIVNNNLRELCAYIIKMSIVPRYRNLPENFQNFFKTCLLYALHDDFADIRKASGIVIAAIARNNNYDCWSDIPSALLTIISDMDSSKSAHYGSLSTMLKLCEDVACELDCDVVNNPLATLFPICIRNLASNDALICELSLKCVNEFIVMMPTALIVSMNRFFNALSTLASDCRHAKIRELVTESLMLIATSHADLLCDDNDTANEKFNAIAEFVLSSCMDDDYSVKRRGCEFWLSLFELGIPDANDTENGIERERDDTWQLCEEFLPRLMPVLLDNMRYEIKEIDGERCDAMIELEQCENSNFLAYKDYRTRREKEKHVNDDDDDDDDNDGAEPVTRWNLRKFAGVSFEYAARLFPDDVILPIILPLLSDSLNSINHDSSSSSSSSIEQHLIIERTLLACGMISRFNEAFLDVAGAELFPFIIKNMEIDSCSNDLCSSVYESNSLASEIKSISCWCIGGFGSWICNISASNDDGQLEICLSAVFSCIQDNDPRIQFTGLGTLGSLCETIGPTMLEPYLNQIIDVISFCLERNESTTEKIRLSTLDLLGLVCDCFGFAVASCRALSRMTTSMMKLFDKWWSYGLDTDNDNNDSTKLHPNLFPILDCLICCIDKIGPDEFCQYSSIVLNRCILMIEMTLIANASEHDGLLIPHHNDGNNRIAAVDVPTMAFVVRSLDLLSTIILTYEDSFVNIVDNLPNRSHEWVYLILTECLVSEHEEVRQGSLSVFGEIISHCPQLLTSSEDLETHITASVLPQLMNSIDIEYQKVAANACWAFGRLAMCTINNTDSELKETMTAWARSTVSFAMQQMCVIISHNTSLSGSLRGNIVVCVGQCGMAFPDIASNSIHNIMLLTDQIDIERSYLGLLHCLHFNLQAAEDVLEGLLYCAVHLTNFIDENDNHRRNNNDDDHNNNSREILSAFKDLFEHMSSNYRGSWKRAMNNVTNETRKCIGQYYDMR